jgi:hypothetical protein
MEKKVSIQKISVQELKVRIREKTTVISERFSNEAKKKILDKQMHKANKGRDAKDPQALFKQSLYPVPGMKDAYGLPAVAFKRAMVDACRNITGFTMAMAKGAFFVVGDIVPIEAKEIRMREDIVRLATPARPADIRFRGEFVNWTATLHIEYNEDVISAEQVVNLLNIAGFAVGVGGWRPQCGGNHGRFEVVQNENI